MTITESPPILCRLIAFFLVAQLILTDSKRNKQKESHCKVVITMWPSRPSRVLIPTSPLNYWVHTSRYQSGFTPANTRTWYSKAWSYTESTVSHTIVVEHIVSHLLNEASSDLKSIVDLLTCEEHVEQLLT